MDDTKLKLRYDGPFESVEVRAAGVWFTATQGSEITISGTQVDAFRGAEGWTPVDGDWPSSKPVKKAAAKKATANVEPVDGSETE